MNTWINKTSFLSKAGLRTLITCTLIATSSQSYAWFWEKPKDIGGSNKLIDVMIVGNAVDGTVNFVDTETHMVIGTVDVAKDQWWRMLTDPINTFLLGFNVLREGSQRILDDSVVTLDGTTLIASRGWMGDVVAFDLTKTNTPMIWRYEMDGPRSDHMDISLDGSEISVSDTLKDKVVVLNSFTGKKISSFPTGAYAHGNDYSHSGKYIYNGSIGSILHPYSMNDAKGDKLLTIADAETHKVIKTYQFEWGLRPSVYTPDDKTMYAQFSYHRGFSTIDLETGEITATYDLPASDHGLENFSQYKDYPNNSAHHGMALSQDGKKLCLAGTIDNYIAVVDLESATTDNIIYGPETPYWASTGPNGNYCYVSNSYGDSLSVIDFATATEVARINVGSFPQRSRAVKVREGLLNGLFGW
jgi:YVTN family beta-propeller protein